MKSFKQRYSNILKELGMTQQEINRIIYKSKFYDVCSWDERQALLKDYELVASRSTSWNEEDEIAEGCYGDDDYYLYRNGNSIAFLHRNYMCGCGTDYWLYVA